MNFEIRDGKDRLPDEEDIYGVNDIEEQDEFNRLMGMNHLTQEARLARRSKIMIAVIIVLIGGLLLAGAATHIFSMW